MYELSYRTRSLYDAFVYITHWNELIHSMIVLQLKVYFIQSALIKFWKLELDSNSITIFFCVSPMFYHCTICAFEVSTLTRVAVDVYLILRWKSDTNVYYKNLGNFCKTLLILYLHRDHHFFFRCISLRVSLFLIEWQLNRECESAINCLFLCGSDTLSTSFWCFFLSWFSVNEWVWVSMCWSIIYM